MQLLTNCYCFFGPSFHPFSLDFSSTTYLIYLTILAYRVYLPHCGLDDLSDVEIKSFHYLFKNCSGYGLLLNKNLNPVSCPTRPSMIFSLPFFWFHALPHYFSSTCLQPLALFLIFVTHKAVPWIKVFTFAVLPN